MALTTRSSKGAELSYAEVDANWTELEGRTGYGWRDLVCGLETRSGATQPTLQNFRNGIYLYAFVPDVMQECFASAHIDHDYEIESDLYPHFHWTTDTTNIGTVRWGYEYTWAQRFDDSGNVVFGPTNTIYVETAADGTPYKHYVSQPAEGSGIDGTGMNVDTLLLIRIFRDATHANDTYPDPVYGITFDLHYRSVRYATPNRDPSFF